MKSCKSIKIGNTERENEKIEKRRKRKKKKKDRKKKEEKENGILDEKNDEVHQKYVLQPQIRIEFEHHGSAIFFRWSHDPYSFAYIIKFIFRP